MSVSIVAYKDSDEPVAIWPLCAQGMWERSFVPVLSDGDFSILTPGLPIFLKANAHKVWRRELDTLLERLDEQAAARLHEALENMPSLEDGTAREFMLA